MSTTNGKQHRDIFSLLDEIQTIARNGLNHTSSAYDRERYEQLLNLATGRYGDLLSLPDEKIRARFDNEIGYITPKVGTAAAIFDEGGNILLMDRADGSGWCLPCGWIEPNEKPADATIREVFEETGLRVEINRLVGVFTRMPNAGNGPHTIIVIVFLCDVIDGALTLSHEGSSLRYWNIDEMQAWNTTHERYAREARQMRQSKKIIPSVFY